MANEGSTKATYSAEEWKYSHPAMKALHDLTPGGSEFAGNPKYCADYIRKREHSQHETIVAKVRENQHLKSELARVRGLLQRTQDELREANSLLRNMFDCVFQAPIAIGLIRDFLNKPSVLTLPSGAESADIGKLDTVDKSGKVNRDAVLNLLQRISHRLNRQLMGGVGSTHEDASLFREIEQILAGAETGVERGE